MTMADLTAFAGYCQGVCPLEGSRGVHHPARQHLQDPLRLCAAGAAGQHRPAEPEDHAVVLFGFRSYPRYPRAHHRRRQRPRRTSSEDPMEKLLKGGCRMTDEKKARRVIDFIQCLRHTKGKFHGKPFKLLPWQEKIIPGCVRHRARGRPHHAPVHDCIYRNTEEAGGKALALSTLLPTPQGWKQMEDIRVGDQCV